MVQTVLAADLETTVLTGVEKQQVLAGQAGLALMVERVVAAAVVLSAQVVMVFLVMVPEGVRAALPIAAMALPEAMELVEFLVHQRACSDPSAHLVRPTVVEVLLAALAQVEVVALSLIHI